MSNTTTHLSLPYIQGGQAQKHVTHNEALRKLDLAVQLSVRAEADAPLAPGAEGDRYIVGAAPVVDWAGQSGRIAQFESGAWVFTAPSTGWVAYDESTGGQVVFDGSAWGPAASGAGPFASLGINTSADSTNRLSVASEASLFSHDGGGHQVKVNKAGAGDTASLLFQTGWSGRAEMGLAGSDDFEIKVSPDGATFHTALTVSRQDGAVSFPNTALASPAYVASVSDGLVANGTGVLGAGINAPAGAIFDAGQSPNLAGAFSVAGHFAGPLELPQTIAVDPNKVYRLGCYLRQESVAGDWSAWAEGERHAQYVGLRCYDVDGLPILAMHHARHRHGGTDSLTELAQPLAPGDAVIEVTDASGWNETDNDAQRRGVVIFGYTSATGQSYEAYSRIEEEDLFDLGDVNKSTGVITLNKPLPAALGNPNDAGGVWPAGTKIANRSSGFHQKCAFCEDVVLPGADGWYQLTHAIGGIDRSGRNLAVNFAPGTATVKLVLMLNYTNRPGGFAGYPDTGAAQRAWVSGLSMQADPVAQAVTAADGAQDIFVVSADPGTGTVSMGPLAPGIAPV